MFTIEKPECPSSEHELLAASIGVTNKALAPQTNGLAKRRGRAVEALTSRQPLSATQTNAPETETVRDTAATTTAARMNSTGGGDDFKYPIDSSHDADAAHLNIRKHSADETDNQLLTCESPTLQKILTACAHATSPHRTRRKKPKLTIVVTPQPSTYTIVRPADPPPTTHSPTRSHQDSVSNLTTTIDGLPPTDSPEHVTPHQPATSLTAPVFIPPHTPCRPPPSYGEDGITPPPGHQLKRAPRNRAAMERAKEASLALLNVVRADAASAADGRAAGALLELSREDGGRETDMAALRRDPRRHGRPDAGHADAAVSADRKCAGHKRADSGCCGAAAARGCI